MFRHARTASATARPAAASTVATKAVVLKLSACSSEAGVVFMLIRSGLLAFIRRNTCP